MAQYSYEAVNKSGEKVKGQLEATGENELRVMLRTQQLRPTKIQKITATKANTGNVLSFFAGRITDEDVLMFTRQLAILINSGIPLLQGLEIISSQLPRGAMQNIVDNIKEKVSGGSFLWESLSVHKNAFSDLYISMIKAGEASGALDSILKRLMRYLEDAIKLKKIVKGAMVYPVVVVCIGIAVVLVMLVWVIPKFEMLLESSNQKLPAITQFVIDASHFCVNYFFIIFGFIIAFAILIQRYSKTEEGRNFLDAAALKVPLFGPLTQKVAVARFARTMQTMLMSGINLLDSIDVCKGAVGNRTFASHLVKVRTEVETGKNISLVLSKIAIFPRMMVQMITVGENTGNLDLMLERVADFYEEEVQNTVANLTKLIEPLVLVVLGGLVAGLMVAMYLPIFKMAG